MATRERIWRKESVLRQLNWVNDELEHRYEKTMTDLRDALHYAAAQPKHRAAEGFIDQVRFTFEQIAHERRNAAAALRDLMAGPRYGFRDLEAYRAAREAGVPMNGYEEVDALVKACKDGSCDCPPGVNGKT